MKTTSSIIILLVALLGGYVWYYAEMKEKPIACTLEAKICPDGTAVGRTGPNCEFRACPSAKKEAENTLTVGELILAVEIADTREERARGLSGRETLAEDAGMLFVFEESGFHSFWMKDTLIPLDILWIDEEKRIVHIEENILPSSFPQPFVSPVPARYVLEVNAGLGATYGIEEGERVIF